MAMVIVFVPKFPIIMLMSIVCLFLVLVAVISFSIIMSNLCYLGKSFFSNRLWIRYSDDCSRGIRWRRRPYVTTTTIVNLSLTTWRSCIFVFRKSPAIWEFGVVYKNFLALFHDPGNVRMLVTIQFNYASISLLFIHLSFQTSTYIINVKLEFFDFLSTPSRMFLMVIV